MFEGLEIFIIYINDMHVCGGLIKNKLSKSLYHFIHIIGQVCAYTRKTSH